MKRLLLSLGVVFGTGVFIWCGLGLVAPDIYVEKAFVIIVYPSIIAGIVASLVSWSRARKRRAGAAG